MDWWCIFYCPVSVSAGSRGGGSLPPRHGSAAVMAITHFFSRLSRAPSFHNTRPQAVLVSFRRALIKRINCPKRGIEPPAFKARSPSFLARKQSSASCFRMSKQSRSARPRLQFDSAPFNYKLHKSYFPSGASPANVNTISRKFCSQENLFVSGQLEWLWYGLV